LLNKLRALLNIKIGSKSVFVKIKRKKGKGIFLERQFCIDA